MKKILSHVTVWALLGSISFSLTGCTNDRVSRLAPEYAGRHTINVSALEALPSTVNYDFLTDDETGLIVLFDNATATHRIFDITTQQFTPNGSSPASSPIRVLDNGLLYSVEYAEDGTNSYTLYSRLGNRVMGEGSIADGVFKDSDTTTRIYVNLEGEIVEESRPFQEIFNNYKAENSLRVGGYYLYSGGHSLASSLQNIIVYDSDGTQIRTFSPTLKLGLSSNTTTSLSNGVYWTLGNSLYFQTTTRLPEMENSYDIYENGIKYNLVTYAYNVKKDTLTKLENFKYKVSAVLLENEENVILSVQSIKHKNIVQQAFIQSFDNKGDVEVNIQALVPGAINYSYDNASDYSYFDDYSGYTHIYDGDKHLRTLDSDWRTVGKSILTVDYDDNNYTNTLNIYSLENDTRSDTISNVKSYGITYNNNIYYQTLTNVFGVYDTRTWTNTSNNLSLNETIKSATPYYVVAYDAVNNRSCIIFMDSSADDVLFKNDFQSFPYSVGETNYEILKNFDGSAYNYRLLVITNPYVK